MEKVLTEQQEKELALLTNMYYILMTGADQVLYKAEKYFGAIGFVMAGKMKVKHRLIMSQFITMKNHMEDIEKGYKEIFGEEAWEKRWDEIRVTAAYCVRLIALICDRCDSEEEDWKMEKMIEEYVSNLPSSGYCTEEFLKRFRVK